MDGAKSRQPANMNC